MAMKPIERFFRKRLRVLVDPIHIQISNLSGSSTYHRFSNLVSELVRRGHYVYWMLPQCEYEPSLLEEHPHVSVVRTSPIQDQFLLDGLIHEGTYNYFNRISGKYHIDVIATQRTSMGHGYKKGLEGCRFYDSDTEYADKTYSLPTTIIEGFPQSRWKDHTSRSYDRGQLMGYLGADMTFFQSAHNREMITTGMLNTFRSSIVEDWLKNQTSVIAPGIRTAELDTFIDDSRWKLESTFNVLSVGRYFGESHAHFLPWLDYLYKSGENISITVTLGGGLGGPMRAKMSKLGLDPNSPAIKINTKTPRRIFLASLKKYHAFVCPVSHYDHPTGLFEVIYLGIPGVIPISDYQQTFFRDWPWTVKPNDHAALLGHLMWIKENPEEARAMVIPYRQMLRDRFDSIVNNSIICDHIEAAGRAHINRYKTSRGVINMLKELEGDEYNWDDLVYYLRRYGHTGVSIGDQTIRQPFTYAAATIHHSMHLAGFSDPCDRPDRYFIRNSVFEERYG